MFSCEFCKISHKTIFKGTNPTGSPRRIDVDSTWILRRYVEDQISTSIHVISANFFDGRKIHVVSTYFFRRNFAGQKIHVISTYFFRCNFNGRKIHVVSTYSFRCNFAGRKIQVVSTYFFWCNLSDWNMHVVFTYRNASIKRPGRLLNFLNF